MATYYHAQEQIHENDGVGLGVGLERKTENDDTNYTNLLQIPVEYGNRTKSMRSLFHDRSRRRKSDNLLQ